VTARVPALRDPVRVRVQVESAPHEQVKVELEARVFTFARIARDGVKGHRVDLLDQVIERPQEPGEILHVPRLCDDDFHRIGLLERAASGVSGPFAP
jgi:hypothetical protein